MGLILMTGDSMSDANALKNASVGICMGSGCSVTKDNSDLVLLKDDFFSIFNAIMWGRTIFENVRKYVQFQLTMNISIALVVFFSCVVCGKPPFNVIQLLWINLNMDVFGAIALCTEPFISRTKEKADPSNIKNKRISRRDKLIVNIMWRNILTVTAYQVLVMIILMFIGQVMFFDESFNIITEPSYKKVSETQDDGTSKNVNKPTNRLVLNTICVHTFMIMNLFNMLCSRNLSEKSMNFFRNIHHSWFFIFSFLAQITIQNGMQFGASRKDMPMIGFVLGNCEMSLGQHITCWSLGVGVIIV